jgi:hypothetical protein
MSFLRFAQGQALNEVKDQASDFPKILTLKKASNHLALLPFLE